MASAENQISPYEAAAATLREKEARLVAELDAVRKSLVALEAASAAAGLPAIGAPRLLIEPSTVVSEKFIGVGLEQAAAKVVSESDHIELTAKQIWNVLSAAGYSLLSDRPE